jgi:carbon-monoxide dehydrogenase medium subunit
MTTLEPDELVTAIHFPPAPAGLIVLFNELARRPGDFALVGLVGSLDVAGGKIASAGLAWFGMGPTPIKARRAEEALAGQAVGGIDPAQIAALAVAETEPFDDHHATADYRRRVGAKIFARSLAQALDTRQAA